DGGAALGGGIFLRADASSVNTSTVTNATLDGNTVTAGVVSGTTVISGGSGGDGANTGAGTASGGAGGTAAGGGLYNTSLNAVVSALAVTGSTMAGHRLIGGVGGVGGRGSCEN